MTAATSDAAEAMGKAGSRWSVVGPVALGIFACAGQLKSNSLLGWLPADLTFAMAIVLSLSALTSIKISRLPAGAAWIVFLICIVFVLGLFDASDGGAANSGASKSTTLFTLTLLALVAPLAMLSSERSRRGFLITLATLAFSVGIAVIVFPAQVNDYSSIAALDGANTIGTARILGAGLIIIFVTLVTRAASRTLHRCLLTFAAGALLVAMVSTGSRGPFLGVATAILTSLIFAPGMKAHRMRTLVLSIVAAGAGVIWYLMTQQAGGARILGFLGGDRDTSTGTREYLWRTALRAIPDHPLGIGWGGFEFDPHIASLGYAYPHNVLLEMTLESGWIGGITFVAIVIATIAHARRASGAIDGLAFLCLFIFALTNSLFSGDVNDNRLLWIMIGATWVLPIGQVKDTRAARSRLTHTTRSLGL